MKTLILNRFCLSSMGTFGTMDIQEEEENLFSCYTVERPWLGNQPSISCIPWGKYGLELDYYHRGDYPAYEVMDVPNRTEIKIHVANTQADVQGCIGLGQALGYVNRQWAVTNSRRAYERFMTVMKGDPHAMLSIHSAFTY